MKLSDFAFDLPPDLIAQQPPAERGGSRLLVLDRQTGALANRQFRDLPSLLRRGDLLVVNDTRVFTARLLGKRLPGGGVAECLLVRRLTNGPEAVTEGGTSPHRSTGAAAKSRAVPSYEPGEIWEALVHPGQRLKEGARLEFGDGAHVVHGEVLDRRFHGRRIVRLWTEASSLTEAIDAIGHVPLPPYIKRPDVVADRDRYQTVYARARGSIAAPTAGLHFTPDIFSALDACGVERTAITLHVGYGTFQPVRTERVEDHRMEEERYEVSAEAAIAISQALADGRRVVAVGTTTTRTLESLTLASDGRVQPGTGWTSLFIAPGYCFRVVSGLVTNFHLPQSSLLLLVSAFAGRDRVLRAYRHAIGERYRFYSYGDAMVIL